MGNDGVNYFDILGLFQPAITKTIRENATLRQGRRDEINYAWVVRFRCDFDSSTTLNVDARLFSGTRTFHGDNSKIISSTEGSDVVQISGHEFQVIFKAEASRTEFNHRNAQGVAAAGAWAKGTAGLAFGAKVGLPAGPYGSIPGALIGGVVGAGAGYVVGGLTADFTAEAKYFSVWRVVCVCSVGDGSELTINTEHVTAPDRNNATGSLSWDW